MHFQLQFGVDLFFWAFLQSTTEEYRWMALLKVTQVTAQTRVSCAHSSLSFLIGTTNPIHQSGHTGSLWDGSFAGPGNDDAIIDFAWRALHMTTVAAKSITTEFYHRPYTKSYFMGCSTGGRQGIKAMSAFPEDYDGLILGSPANPFGQLMPWQAKQGHQVHPVGSARWIPQDTWKLIHAEALRQCDMIDGVQDGIISDPLACDFHPETLKCQLNADPSTCLTSKQLDALRDLYAPYHLGPDNQTYVFSPFVPGGEYAYPQGLVGDTPFQMPGDYYRYFVLNDTTWQDEQLDEAVVTMGIDLNPGQMDTYSPDLTAFFARGGKILQYAGWDDELVSTGHSNKWFEDVTAHTIAHSDLDPNDHFHIESVNRAGPLSDLTKLGNGAWAFGGVLGRHFGGPTVTDEAPYDIQTAIVNWLEFDREVTHLVAAKYRDDDEHSGGMRIAFTRKLCPVGVSLL
ncbi:hypothetical protein QFC22_004293 [Naganishia vaughanmartiniae]|uniref:Uncharacterized protein n=1 Tax=Naganishia vaughanmartiniae TaxID=1424756 RepID=A0ACC2X0B1_9TREE|nr:hypothetical protein QFC22_004293 [Naganishia vaughanmartiniae]